MPEVLIDDSSTSSIIDGDQFGNDPRTSVQPGQQFQGSESILAIQGPPPQHQDLSRWHAHCQSFLIQTIQRQTERDVHNIALNSTSLMHHLSQQLERRYYQDSDLSFLNLKESSKVRVPQAVSQDTNSLGRSSTTSESSVGSMSSQISDSFNNDVQESTEMLMQSLRGVMDEVHPSFSKKLRSLAFFVGAQPQLQKDNDQFYKTIDNVKQTLLEFQPEMHSIGFPDVGLKLNIYGDMFREDVVKFFDIVKREKGQGMKALWNILDDKKTPWKPWKDHQHRPFNEWKPWHEYSHLQSRTIEIGEKVKETLEVAVATRDSFLVAACSILNEAALKFAREAGIEVHDKFQDGILVKRIFGDSEDDDDIQEWVLRGWRK